MPIVNAFPLGLLLAGTTSVTLADGKSAPLLTATGRVEIGDQSEIGVVILQGGASDILLGMDFLAKFGRVLFIHPNKGLASLMDQKEVDPLIDLALKTAKEAEAKAKAAAAPEVPDAPPEVPLTDSTDQQTHQLNKPTNTQTEQLPAIQPRLTVKAPTIIVSRFGLNV